ncbi:MAG: hypothetical protein R6W77_13090 [Trueperaceae bacterium]
MDRSDTNAHWTESPVTLRRLARVGTATLSTQLFARGFRTRCPHGVAPLRSGQRLVGAARTLRFVPMREDLDSLASLASGGNAQRAIVERIGPGEVVVIDASGDTRAGSLGDILARRLQERGAAGIVTDGALRDVSRLAELNLPAFAAGRAPNPSLVAHHPVDIDVPIGCGGVLVEPGDAVVGDDDGVVVIPADLVIEVAADAWAQERQEAFVYRLVEAGARTSDVYPMNEETRRAYEAWTETHPDEDEG